MSTVTGLSKPSNETSGLTRRFYLTAWRWHFYAGLYVAPFLIMLAITGLIMLWAGALVGRDGENAFKVAPGQSVALIAPSSCKG